MSFAVILPISWDLNPVIKSQIVCCNRCAHLAVLFNSIQSDSNFSNVKWSGFILFVPFLPFFSPFLLPHHIRYTLPILYRNALKKYNKDNTNSPTHSLNQSGNRQTYIHTYIHTYTLHHSLLVYLFINSSTSEPWPWPWPLQELDIKSPYYTIPYHTISCYTILEYRIQNTECF